jgi:hypothetical protein
MESLVFVLLFTVAVMMWMSEGAQADMSIRQVCVQRVVMCGEQACAGMPRSVLSSQPVTISDKGPWCVHLRRERRPHAGRSRPSST